VLADFGEARAYDSVGEAFTARNRWGAMRALNGPYVCVCFCENART